MEFVPFPKVPRLSRDVVITEKLDGTNASVVIVRDDTGGIEYAGQADDAVGFVAHGASQYHVFAGSRNRWITPAKDNFGFAAWVQQNAAALVVALGEGTHFGEWWGRGIQRNYSQTERRFSLFNVKRWGHHPDHQGRVGPCSVVPTLYAGPMEDNLVMKGLQNALRRLKTDGSVAAPGFMNPEGVIVFHSASGAIYKKTFEKDDKGKDN